MTFKKRRIDLLWVKIPLIYPRACRNPIVKEKELFWGFVTHI
jgi:hypothetical protein